MCFTRLPPIRPSLGPSPRAAASLPGSTYAARIPPKYECCATSVTARCLRSGIVDGPRGYLVEIYRDNDHTELLSRGTPCPSTRSLLRPQRHRRTAQHPFRVTLRLLPPPVS